MNNLRNTGERLLTDNFDIYTIEHLHRYAVAMSLCQNLEVLDMASGEGYGTNLLSKVAKNAIGIDISKDAIDHARLKYTQNNLSYIVGSANSIPLQENSLDRVVSFETLEHHNLHEEMFGEIKRVLRPNGIAIISTPDKLNYSDIPKQNNEFHVKELYLEEFRTLAQKHFKHIAMLYQEVEYLGIITPEKTSSHKFQYYIGDFDKINTYPTIPNSIYNICLASDTELPELAISTYSGKRILQTIHKQLNDTTDLCKKLDKLLNNSNTELKNINNSASYLIGKAITYPYRLVRNIFE